jgi:L-lactate dehydrogenase complex protein LldG
VVGEAVSAREEILERIRAARVAAAAPVAGEYRRALGRDRAALVALFAERIADYDVTLSYGDVVALEAKRLAVPLDLPDEWRPGGVELVPDDGLSNAELDALDGALTGCALAIADTGTIVLDCGAAQGRRALTLIPDLHICVVREDQIVGSVPEAFDRLTVGRPVTFVSGPSATSDIELNRVRGVHGPRRLHVVIV